MSSSNQHLMSEYTRERRSKGMVEEVERPQDWRTASSHLDAGVISHTYKPHLSLLFFPLTSTPRPFQRINKVFFWTMGNTFSKSSEPASPVTFPIGLFPEYTMHQDQMRLELELWPNGSFVNKDNLRTIVRVSTDSLEPLLDLKNEKWWPVACFYISNFAFHL